MLKIKFPLLLLCMLLLQTVCNTILAQCNSVTITNVSTTPETCKGNGTITVTVSGADINNIQLPTAQFRLLKEGEVYQTWTTWSRSADNLKHTFNTAERGVYTVEMQAFCELSGEWTTHKIAAEATVPGSYAPLGTSIETPRKSMICRHTGEVKLNISGGTPPYNVDLTVLTGDYDGKTSFPGSESKITIGDLAPGNYRIIVSDNCPDSKIGKTFTIGAIATDLPANAKLVANVARCGTDCRSVKPDGYNALVSSDPDQQYYWDNAGLYYQYDYLLNDAGTINWKPLSSKQPEFLLSGPYMDFCGSGKTLVSYVKPAGAGCETVTPQKVVHTFCSVNVFNYVSDLPGNTDATARLNCSIAPGCEVIYPATWEITKKGTTAPLIANDQLEAGQTIISNAATSVIYERGVTYTITLTGADGREFIRDWSVPLITPQPEQTLSIYNPYDKGYHCMGEAGRPIGSSYIQLYTSGNILPGTTIEYVDGPKSLGMGDKGAVYTIPANYNSGNFYPSSTFPTIATYSILTPGTYTFRITPPSGVSYDRTITQKDNYYVQEIAYTTVQTCNGLEVTPAGGLQSVNAAGVAADVTDANFRIAACPECLYFDEKIVTQGAPDGKLLLQSPGAYRIEMLAPGTTGCAIAVTEIVYQGFHIDLEQSSYYHCGGDAGGVINVQVANGVDASSYTYIVKNAGGVELKRNNTGLFPEIGVPGGTYNLIVQDEYCLNSTSASVTLLELKNENIAYTVNNGEFCEGSEIQINCVTLGNTTYKWDGPNEFESTIEKPRNLMAHPDSKGKYTVTVTPENCAKEFKGELEIHVLPAPKLDVTKEIRLCVGSGFKNIVALSGLSMEEGCELKWYKNLISTTTINPPTAHSTIAVGTTRYYVSKACKKDECETAREEIQVIVVPKEACCSQDKPLFTFTQPDPYSKIIDYNTTHTFPLAAARSDFGNITYLWEQSLDNKSWTTAPGENTAATYTTPQLTENRYYRRKAFSESCEITSDTALVIVMAMDDLEGVYEYYVKETGAGDGSSWENAMSNENFARILPFVPDGVTFHIAAGTYHPVYEYGGSFSKNISNRTFEINSCVTLIGGYPKNAQTGAVSEPEKPENKTLFDGNIGGETVYNMIYSYLPSLKVSLSGLYMENTASNAIACYSNDSELYVNYVTISNSQGRAIEAPYSLILKVENAAFYKNNGAIGAYYSAGKAILNNVRLEENFWNRVVDCGTESLQMDRVVAKNNTAQLINMSGKNLTITDADFKDNQSDNHLIYCSNSYANVKIERTVFDGNESNGNALLIYVNTVAIDNCIFRNGKSEGNYDAVYIYCSENCNIANSTFDNNSAKRILYLASKGNLINNTFTRNKTENILFIYSSENNLIHNTIAGNECRYGIINIGASSSNENKSSLIGNIVLGNKGSCFTGYPYANPITKYNIFSSYQSSWSLDESDINVTDSETAGYLQVLDGYYDTTTGLFVPTLKDNGGFTPTVALTGTILPNGKVINSLPLNISNIPTDQRGVTRNDPTCIGAYEISCNLPEVTELSIINEDTPCRGEEFTLTLTGLPDNPKGVFQYAWSFPNTEVEVTEKSATNATRIKVLERIPTLPVTVTLTSVCGNSVPVNGKITMSGMNEVTISDIDENALYCKESTPIALAGTPEGGIFKINGIESAEFDPSKMEGSEATIRYEALDTESGCYSYDEKTVRLSKVDPELNLNIELLEPVKQTLCYGERGSIGFTITGGAGDYLYTVNRGAPVQAGIEAVTLSDLEPDKYLIEAWLKDDQCAGKATYNVTFTESELLQATHKTTKASCALAKDGSIEVEAIGGVGTYLYELRRNGQLRKSQSSSLFDELSAGTYQVVVFDADQCQAVIDVEVSELTLSPLTLTVVDTKDETCYGQANGEVTVSYTGGAAGKSVTVELRNSDGDVYGTPQTFASQPQTVNFTSIAPGNYQVLAYYAGTAIQCITDGAKEEITVSAMLNPLSVSVSQPKNQTCLNEPDGTLTFTVTGWADTHTAKLNGETQFPTGKSGGQATFTFNTLSKGIHTFTVEDECKTAADRASAEITNIEPYHIDTLSTSGKLLCNADTNGYIELEVKGGNQKAAHLYMAGNSEQRAITENTSVRFENLSVGTYTFRYESTVAGCSDYAELKCTIDEPAAIHSTDTQVACKNYTWIDGNTYTENNNTATHTLTSVTGCDSIVTLNLTISDMLYGTDTQVACESYTWIDGITYTESNNTVTHTLTSINGCDSIVTLNLTINKVVYSTDTQVACESYTWIDGITYTESNNTAKHTLTSVNNCDSIVTLNLTINKAVYSTDTQVTCTAYTWIDGITYTKSNNTATHTLTSIASCDSIVTLNLTILFDDDLPVLILENIQVKDETCYQGNNGSVTIPYSGNTEKGSVMVEVFDLEGKIVKRAVDYSENGSLTVELLAPGKYRATLRYGSEDCELSEDAQERTFTIAEMKEAISFDTPQITDLTCLNEPNGAITIIVKGWANQHTALLNDEAVHPQTTTNEAVAVFVFENLAKGDYRLFVTNECETDSEETEITIGGIDAYELTLNPIFDQLVCSDHATGILEVEVKGGKQNAAHFYLTGTDEQRTITEDINIRFEELSAGAYRFRYQSSDESCSDYAEVEHTITAPQPLKVEADFSGTLCIDAVITLTVTGETEPYEYEWITPENETIKQKVNTLPVSSVGNYTYKVTDAKGCDVKENIITVTLDNELPELTLESINAKDETCYQGNNGAVTISYAGNTNNEPVIIEVFNSEEKFVKSETGKSESGSLTVASLAPGSYRAVLRYGANGCVLSKEAIERTFTVSEMKEAISFGTPQITNLTCLSEPNGAVTITVKGWANQHTALLNGEAARPQSTENGVATFVFTGLKKGDYNLSVTNECETNSDETVITIDGIDAYELTLTPIFDNLVCSHHATGILELEIKGGNKNAAHFYMAGNEERKTITEDSNIRFEELSAGTHRFYYESTENCTDRVFVEHTIDAPDALKVDAQLTGKLCIDAAIVLTVTGEKAPYEYEWITPAGETIQTKENRLPVAAVGNYTYRVEDANGCTLIENTIEVKTPQPLPKLSLNNTAVKNETCYKGNNGAVTVSYSGNTGTEAVIVEVFNSTDKIVGSQTGNSATGSLTVSPLAPGNYRVTLRYGIEGCQLSPDVKTASFVVAAMEEQISINNLKPVALTCLNEPNGSFTAEVSGWADTHKALLNDEAVKPQSVTGQKAVFEITGLKKGDYLFKITNECNSDSDEKSVNITGIEPYQIKITATHDMLDCSYSDDGYIQIESSGGYRENSLVYMAGKPAEYRNPDNVTVKFENLPKGVYSMVYKTEQKGCSDSFTLRKEIKAPEAVYFDFDTLHISCFGKTDGEISLQAYQGSKPPREKVVITDENRETAMQGLEGFTYTWTKIDEPELDLSQDKYRQTVPLERFWHDHYGDTIYNGVVGLDSLPVGRYVCEVMIIPVNKQCFYKSKEIEVKKPYFDSLQVTSIFIDEAAANCKINDRRVEITAQGGWKGYIFSVLTQAEYDEAMNAKKNGDEPANDSTTNAMQDDEENEEVIIYYPDNTAKYISQILQPDTYHVFVTDSLGCQAERTHTFKIDPVVTLTATADSIRCPGESTGKVELTAQGGSGNYVYQIIRSKDNIETFDNPKFENLPKGFYAFAAIENSERKCEGYISVKIEDNKRPFSFLMQEVSDVKCFGDDDGEITFLMSGGSESYTFKVGDDNMSATKSDISWTIQSIGPGAHTLYINDENDCQVTAGFEVKEPAKLEIKEVIGSEVCAGGKGRVVVKQVSGGTMPYSYALSEGGKYETNPSMEAGVDSYYAFVKDGNKCIAKSAEKVEVRDKSGSNDAKEPEIDFTLSTYGYASDVWAIIDISPDKGEKVEFTFSNDYIYILPDSLYKNLSASDSLYRDTLSSDILSRMIFVGVKKDTTDNVKTESKEHKLSCTVTMTVYYPDGCDYKIERKLIVANDSIVIYPEGNITQKQPDILNLTAYPVPILGKDYTIQIEFSNKVDFSVQIYTVAGIFVAQKDFKAEKIIDGVAKVSREDLGGTDISGLSVIRVFTRNDAASILVE